MQKIKELGRKIFVEPIVTVLARSKIPPDVITISSLFFAIIAFLYYRIGNFWLGAIFLFFCGILDTFDGEVARRTNRVTRLGSFLDSTIDRINEFIVYFGLFYYYYNRANYVLFWIVLVIFGSMMVSYTRAKGETLGISPQVGIFERFTRLALFIIGSFFGPRIMVYFLVVLAFGTVLTMMQRIIFVQRQSKEG